MKEKLVNPKEYTSEANEVNIEDLVDICDVIIDPSLPVEEKKMSYLRQIKNPYLFRCSDIIVRISFAENGATLGERLKQLLLSASGLK